MAQIPDWLRRRIEIEGRYRCGYCLTDQKISSALMHLDHILPVSRGGASEKENLWLACARCNAYKGDKIQASDPVTGDQMPLFNPRTQVWIEHFTWSSDGTEIIGITPVGRATVAALQMNHEAVVYSRRLWVSAGWHPPKDGNEDDAGSGPT